MTSTEDYIKSHVRSVQEKMGKITTLLEERAERHDESKLQEPELSGWKQMDLEPRYPYGSPEYKDKMKRYNWLFRMHYSKNSHHPEFYDNDLSEMDLLDLIEMICDWVSYGYVDKNKAYSTFEQQLQRFKFPEYLNRILENTVTRYLCDDKTLSDAKPTSNIITAFEENDRENYKKNKMVMQYLDSVKDILEKDGILDKPKPEPEPEPVVKPEFAMDDLLSLDSVDLEALKKFY